MNHLITMNVHDATPDQWEAIPGEHQRSSFTVWKRIRFGQLEVTVFKPEGVSVLCPTCGRP